MEALLKYSNHHIMGLIWANLIFYGIHDFINMIQPASIFLAPCGAKVLGALVPPLGIEEFANWKPRPVEIDDKHMQTW